MGTKESIKIHHEINRYSSVENTKGDNGAKKINNIISGKDSTKKEGKKS